MRTLCAGVVCAVMLLPAGPARAAQGGGSPVSNAVLRVGTEKIKQLEQKASEYDGLVIKVRQLSSELAEVRTNTVPGRMSSGGRLQDMERKVQGYDALVNLLVKKNKTIAELEKRLEASAQQENVVKEDLAGLSGRVNAMSNTIQVLQVSERSLRATIEQLLLGNFEYYEVKSGDTLETIARKPMIYEDVSKVEWLKQANLGRVKDLNNLMEGEMLVIPRFQQNTPFSF